MAGRNEGRGPVNELRGDNVEQVCNDKKTIDAPDREGKGDDQFSERRTGLPYVNLSVVRHDEGSVRLLQ